MGGAHNKAVVRIEKTPGGEIQRRANVWATVYIDEGGIIFSHHDEAFSLAISFGNKAGAITVSNLAKIAKFLGRCIHIHQDWGSKTIFQGLITTLSNNPAMA